MRIIEGMIQGSPEWNAHRATSRNGSEAAAMFGTSDYMSRTALLNIKRTGIAPEIDAATQRRFDDGHAIEAFARPIAEKELGEELFPVTATDDDGYLSSSMDGLTMLGDIILWECKQSNAKLRAALDAGDLPDSHWPQVEQGLLVSGAEKCLFTISDGTEEGTKHIWYYSKPERSAQIIPGWRQFDADLAAYVPQEVIPAAVAAPIADLPALNIQISGSVVASNLVQWKDVVIARIGEISTDLQTDNDFATAESTVKFLDDGEKRIDLVKAQAQAQASDIDAVFRAMDEIKAMMRSKRLELDKLVKQRKEAIRVEITLTASKALQAHIDGLNARIGKPYMPACYGDFAGAIKGKRTIQSLRDACDGELARCKIEAEQIASRIEANMKTLRELAADHAGLFADTAQLVLKDTDAVEAIVKSRIAEHKAAEGKRLEAERERIRAEEETRANAAAAAKLKSEREEAERHQRAADSATNTPATACQNTGEDGTKETPAPGTRETLPGPTLGADNRESTNPLFKGGSTLESVVNAVGGTLHAATDTGATIKLGDINSLLGFTVTADFLAVLRFQPARTEKTAKLYRQCDFPAICAAIAHHVNAVAATALQKAA